jgi:two-component system sensor histidine kinase RegB
MRRPPDTNLLPRLIALRWIEVACQLLVLLGVQRWLAVDAAQLKMLFSIVVALAAFNLVAWWRARQAWLVTDTELFAQICVDVLALAGLLYFSGGSSNPFVSLFLLPLTICAAILPPAYALAMAILSLSGYTLLLFFNVPLPGLKVDLPLLQSLGAGGTAPAAAMAHMDHMNHGKGAADSGFALHLLGMWFNFLVSAGIIAFFLARLAATLRLRDRELAKARENALRNEQILALGTLAAGAAHQLGTPLSTMAVVIHELEIEHAAEPRLNSDLALLRRQVDNCKDLLGKLLSAAGRPRGEDAAARPLDALLGELIERWCLLRPKTIVTTHWLGEAPAPMMLAEPTLEQALLNLLDNAADASPQEVAVEARWNADSCVIDILDSGPGLVGGAAQKVGQPFFTTKREQGGLGIGLFLSNATLERFGGKVELFNRSAGGACTRITLPLGKLQR